MIESMSTTPGIGDGAPRPAPQEATRPPMAPSMPKAPDASVIAADNSLAAEITTDLTAVPPRLDAALADAAGLPAPTEAQEPKQQGLTPEEMRSFGTKAERFIEEHPNEIVNGQEVPYDQFMLTDARRSVDPQIGQRFDAHGIDTLSADGIQRLNDLLVNGVDPSRPFFTAQLSSEPNSGAVSPRDTGSFILIGKPDQQIKDGGIGGVIVHEAYYDAIPRLQEAYPGVKFIRADQMTEGLSEMLKPAASPEPLTETGSAASDSTPTPEPSETIAPEAATPETSPAEQPTTEPTPQPTESTPPNAPAEDSTPTDGLSQDQLAEIVADIARDTEPQGGFSFGLGEKARAALATAEAKGELSVADRKTLEDEIARADYQEALLLTNVSVITSKQNFEGQKTTPEEVANAGQTVREAIAIRKETYKEMFAGIKKSAKAAHREYGDALSDLKSDARAQMETYESAYEAAKEKGTPQDIADAKMRFEAAKEHYLIINKEKRKELLKGLLKALGLSMVTTLISDSTKQVKGGAMGPQRH